MSNSTANFVKIAFKSCSLVSPWPKYEFTSFFHDCAMWLRSAMAKYVCAGEREIVVHLTKIWGFVCCPKLCACFHALCLHTSMCMLMNIIEELRRPNLRFTESFVKIWHSFAEIWGFVYRPRFSTCLHSLCMHACMCMPMNINYQLRNWILSYTNFFVKIWLPFGWDMRVCLLPHKLRAGFHVLCMHASMCMPMNILNLGICWNFCEDRTSFGWDIRVCLPSQVVCTFSRAVCARMHVNARMWMHACACPWTLLINSGDQFWHIVIVLWRSALHLAEILRCVIW